MRTREPCRTGRLQRRHGRHAHRSPDGPDPCADRSGHLRPRADAAGRSPAGATQDPQATADTQAANTTLSQIETDLSTMDRATTSGENDVPSN